MKPWFVCALSALLITPLAAEPCLQGSWRTEACPNVIYQSIEEQEQRRILCVCLEDFQHLRQPLDASNNARLLLQKRELERLAASYDISMPNVQRVLRLTPATEAVNSD
ncbi:hypothetical protein [Ferrimonas pelagia]|uniref:Uncharacterized protein n=1 Tax=Ferrimonas pelagia TaxID=1177826 RepID=A0ABP9EAY4_9GAMM